MAASERGTVQALQRWAELGLLTPAQVQAIRAMLGTPDGSLWSQYWTYLGELFRGNLGISFTYFPFPVTEVMAKALPWSIMLIGITQVLAYQVADDVRAGKLIELDLQDGVSDADVEEMCRKLLANTVIENFRIERDAA